jgi:hypothetical protein
MGQRLGEDRMCFALNHVVMPEEPVVFIEVALSRGLLRSIHDVIDDRVGRRRPVTSPDTAIFYSINNTQNGLAGLGLGKVLIARVTEALRKRHPSLRTYSTLSPIPGFWPRYLRPILEGRDERFRIKKPDVLKKIPAKAQQAILDRYRDLGGKAEELAEALLAVLARPAWIEDSVFPQALRKPLIEPTPILPRRKTPEADRSTRWPVSTSVTAPVSPAATSTSPPTPRRGASRSRAD